MDFRHALSGILSPDQIKIDEPMARHTTMRVGGPADAFVCPDTPDQAVQVLAWADNAGVPCLVLGNGSNLIVRDKGVRGMVLWTGALNKIEIRGTALRAQAGAALSAVSAEAHRSGLAGLEFASGIPGTVGGATAMNAGAYGEQVSDVLTRARLWMDGTDRWYEAEELDMGYRSTLVLKRGGVVLEAEFALRAGDPVEIKEKMDRLNAGRRDKQPLQLPSAGSTFKRPEGHFAGALIEGAGLKGTRAGGAQVSEKHAGFIVNAGGASAGDVLDLIALVQQKVLETYGVRLEPEVRVVGEE